MSLYFLFDEICCPRFTILFTVWSLLVDLASSWRAFVFMSSRKKCSVRSCLKPLLRTTLSHQDMICSVVRVLSWTAETLFWHSAIDGRRRRLRWLRSFSVLDTKTLGSGDILDRISWCLDGVEMLKWGSRDFLPLVQMIFPSLYRDKLMDMEIVWILFMFANLVSNVYSQCIQHTVIQWRRKLAS